MADLGTQGPVLVGLASDVRARHQRRHDLRTVWLYVRQLLWEFRWTLGLLVAAVLLGGALIHVSNDQPTARPLLKCCYSAWMSMFAQPLYEPDDALTVLMCALYPLLGFVLIGEGVVRLGLLLTSRRHGEKEWVRVVASTYRDHVVLCGLGHLGHRVLEQLVKNQVPVVAIEKEEDGRYMPQARATGVPILIRNMKDDQALLEAGVPYARAIIIASNDDIANVEVALDARRMNPKIRIVMRLFDQQIAMKMSKAFAVDVAFSSSALAAPVVAALSMDTPVLATFPVAGVTFVAAEVTLEDGSVLVGRKIGEVEQEFGARIVACVPKATGCSEMPTLDLALHADDKLVINMPVARFPHFTGAAKSRGVAIS